MTLRRGAGAAAFRLVPAVQLLEAVEALQFLTLMVLRSTASLVPEAEAPLPTSTLRKLGQPSGKGCAASKRSGTAAPEQRHPVQLRRARLASLMH